MAANVEIKVNTVVGQQKMEALKQALNPSVLLRLIGGRFLSYIHETFDTSRHGRWAPLAPITLLLRKRGGSRPLMDTGMLRASYVIESNDRDRVEVGSSAKVPGGQHSLALVHEKGAIIKVRNARFLATKATSVAGLRATKNVGGWVIFGKEVKIPARPVLPSQSEAEAMAKATVEAALQRATQMRT